MLSFSRGVFVRYRTVGIVSAVFVVSIFALPAVVVATLLPNLPDPVPWYEQIILAVAFFCLKWRLLVVIPIVGGLFAVAALSGAKREA